MHLSVTSQLIHKCVQQRKRKNADRGKNELIVSSISLCMLGCNIDDFHTCFKSDSIHCFRSHHSNRGEGSL